MNNNFWKVMSFVLIASLFLTSCEMLGGIFKAGMWTATILIVIVVAIVIWIIAKLSNRNKGV